MVAIETVKNERMTMINGLFTRIVTIQAKRESGPEDLQVIRTSFRIARS
jgi:hypothetical protein